MDICYREAFLKDLKNLKGRPEYQRIYELAFQRLSTIQNIQQLPNVKFMQETANRYRIRVGDYRIGIILNGNTLEVSRVLHRKEFYRYFP